ncbi:hypothetical protein [Ovoidimarina sediminis]|uniref:hypothetical protein n=1 Tax=Ovoidimarina sediminis TaxID=3079856 RepID=UPI00292F353D|nr:hypothetical protein [Rhodophyticola sp. MJ-SS7]
MDKHVVEILFQDAHDLGLARRLIKLLNHDVAVRAIDPRGGVRRASAGDQIQNFRFEFVSTERIELDYHRREGMRQKGRERFRSGGPDFIDTALSRGIVKRTVVFAHQKWRQEDMGEPWRNDCSADIGTSLHEDNVEPVEKRSADREATADMTDSK